MSPLIHTLVHNNSGKEDRILPTPASVGHRLDIIGIYPDNLLREHSSAGCREASFKQPAHEAVTKYAKYEGCF